VPDYELACRTGRATKQVRARRVALGIPRLWWVPAKPWTADELALLGTEPDAFIARKLERSTLAITKRRVTHGIPAVQYPDSMRRRYTRAEDLLVGTMPDAELARRLRRTAGAIGRRRSTLGIRMFQSRLPPLDRQRRRTARPPAR